MERDLQIGASVWGARQRLKFWGKKEAKQELEKERDKGETLEVKKSVNTQNTPAEPSTSEENILPSEDEKGKSRSHNFHLEHQTIN